MTMTLLKPYFVVEPCPEGLGVSEEWVQSLVDWFQDVRKVWGVIVC